MAAVLIARSLAADGAAASVRGRVSNGAPNIATGGPTDTEAGGGGGGGAASGSGTGVGVGVVIGVVVGVVVSVGVGVGAGVDGGVAVGLVAAAVMPDGAAGWGFTGTSGSPERGASTPARSAGVGDATGDPHSRELDAGAGVNDAAPPACSAV